MQELLKTRIKADRITNLTDARYFAARGASWLGFQLDAGGEGQVSPQMFSAIKEWVEGPQMVGVFGASNAEEINQSIALLGLNAIQVGLFTDNKELEQLVDIPVIKEIVVQDLNEVGQLRDQLASSGQLVDSFLINFDKNGLSWDMLQQNKEAHSELSDLCKKFKVIISIVSKPEGIVEIMNAFDPYGFNFAGGDEEKVGFKSFEEMDEIFDLLEEVV